MTPLLQIHQLDKYDGPIDISINRVNGKDRIYLLGANATSVEVFTIQGPGELERIQKLNIAPFARAAGVRFG
ncbi:hypothetical protein AX15_007830 [Amanita polypyramis BW_CC]|nr:hypothetical protein AX15_007830 [Amanita polypyramis BW_CC]